MNALRRRWRIIAMVAAFALAGTAAGALLGERTYTSTATLYIPAASRVGASVGRDDLDYVDRVTNTYQRIASSTSLRADVQRQLRTRADIEIAADPVPNTELMELRVRAPEPTLSRRAANASANALVARIRARSGQTQAEIRAAIARQMRAAEQSLTQLRVQRDHASDPSVRRQLSETLRLRLASYEALAEQSAIVNVAVGADRMPSVAERAGSATAHTAGLRDVMLGLVLGLIGGAGVALLLERRSPQLGTLEDIERATGASVLATVPLARGNADTLVEAFSEMRARLLSAGANGTAAPRTLLITSPREGDGKSLVAANLAVALARAQRRVLLVDADLRQPRMHEMFGLENESGLAELLQLERRNGRSRGRAEPGAGSGANGEARRKGTSVRSFIQKTSFPDLNVLTSGVGSNGARELLASPRMAGVISRLGRENDFVVIDSPSLGTASDAAMLTSLVDAVVLVVGRTPTSDQVIRSARRQLQGTGARHVWVVVNRWRGTRMTRQSAD